MSNNRKEIDERRNVNSLEIGMTADGQVVLTMRQEGGLTCRCSMSKETARWLAKRLEHEANS